MDNSEASPKPALTQGGVVELVADLRGSKAVVNLLAAGGTTAPNLSAFAVCDNLDRAATMIERLAGERGGEAVAWSLVFTEGYGVNAHTTFKARVEAEQYAGKCSQPTPRVVPLYAAPQPLPVEVERERIVWPDDVLDRVEEWVNRKGGDADVRDIAAALIAAAHPALGGGES